jgi:protoporphyrinogen/coproporphyrinogen III oxidase
MKRVVIIGGGITGLAAAQRMLELGHDSQRQCEITLLEASSRVGGIVQTEERDGFLIERGPDSFISEKPAALELAKTLGLESRLIQTNQQHRRSFVVRNGKLAPVPEGFHLIAPARLLPFLKSDILSWSGKVRMAFDLFLSRGNGTESASGDTDESLANFVRRRLGKEALERMAQPMVGGIYTADPELLSLQATMPRFLEMEREHRSLILALRRRGSNAGKVTDETSGARYSLFLSFDRGMQVLTDALAKNISNCPLPIADRGSRQPNAGPPVERVRTNTTVESLYLDKSDPARQGWRIQTNRNETMLADAVCLALPAHASARLLRELDPQLASELNEIPYASTATINLAYKRDDIPHPLDGFGFVVPFIERRSLLACTFSSQKFAGRAPEGQVLLRAFVGGALQPEMLELSCAELLRRVREDLHQLLGITATPIFTEVATWRESMPQYHVGHLERVRRITERAAKLPGLALAGNAYSGAGIPDCIRSGQAAAEELV